MASKKVKIPQVDWTRARPAGVVLLSGPETLLADRAWTSLKQQLRENDPELEIHEVDSAQYTRGELFTLASPSLFGEPRLIRIAAVEKCSDDFITDAKAYLKSPDDTTTLVLRHGGGARGKAVLDAIRQGEGNGIEVICAEVKPADRQTFMRAELQRLDIQMEPSATVMLLDAYQNSLEELAAAIGQLADAGHSRVTEADVENLTGGRVEANAFKVADAAIAGRAAQALVLLRQSLSTGNAPIALLAALNMKVRAMARVYGAHGSAGTIARQFSMAPWQVERAMKDLRGWRETDLARVLDQGAETDFRLKGGARDPEYALERFVLLVARKGKDSG